MTFHQATYQTLPNALRNRIKKSIVHTRVKKRKRQAFPNDGQPVRMSRNINEVSGGET